MKLPAYDIVIATRNRPEALAISLPTVGAQSPRPDRLIIIDSSGDHSAVAAAVRAATQGWSGQVIVEHGGRGLTYQRNRGLCHVTAPIVFFMDDDSLLHPDTSAEMLKVYARNRGG